MWEPLGGRSNGVEKGAATVVLGPGLAAGLGGLGVLLEFERRGVPVRECIGVNTGALAAALWAVGADLALAARVLALLPWARYAAAGDSAGYDPILGVLELLTRRCSFADLRRPVGVVVQELTSGRCTVVRRGSLAWAVRSSLAVPGLIEPISLEGRWEVDPGANWARAVAADLRSEARAVWSFFTPALCRRGIEEADFSTDAWQRSAYAFAGWEAAAPRQGAVIRAEAKTLGLLSFDKLDAWLDVGREAARRWLERGHTPAGWL